MISEAVGAAEVGFGEPVRGKGREMALRHRSVGLFSRLGGAYSGACRKGDRFKMEER